jgi:hypothetical protein
MLRPQCWSLHFVSFQIGHRTHKNRDRFQIGILHGWRPY